MAVRHNSDIIKGSMLMVFYNDNPIGFATSHSLSLTLNTTEVSTKDHGDAPAIIPQTVSWEIQAENLYSDAGELTYMQLMMAKSPVTIKFCKASNYDEQDEKGVIVAEGVEQASKDWTPDSQNIIATGQAYVTSFQINAPAGDNATMSVTFTGNGAITTNGDPT